MKLVLPHRFLSYTWWTQPTSYRQKYLHRSDCRPKKSFNASIRHRWFPMHPRYLGPSNQSKPAETKIKLLEKMNRQKPMKLNGWRLVEEAARSIIGWPGKSVRKEELKRRANEKHLSWLFSAFGQTLRRLIHRSINCNTRGNLMTTKRVVEFKSNRGDVRGSFSSVATFTTFGATSQYP